MRHADGGFSLLELTLAMGLMMMVTASVFMLVDPARGAFSTEPERSDMLQRLRVAADALQKDLMMAGAGSDGPLFYSFAPVLPFGQGITMTYVPASNVAEAVTRTYFLKTDAPMQLTQLMRYDGSANSDVPIADHVVGLSFEYYGEPQPPALTKPVSDPHGPWTTYGPKPPAPGVRSSAWPAGENCAFAMDPVSGRHASRLPALGQSVVLVRLAPAQLTDGPWCPDAVNANRWDADLLRVRTIGVTLRVQAASAALRGPASVLFANGGTSRTADTWVPDAEVRFQVTPRNMNLGR